jgi:hypothetical protein
LEQLPAENAVLPNLNPVAPRDLQTDSEKTSSVDTPFVVARCEMPKKPVSGLGNGVKTI